MLSLISASFLFNNALEVHIIDSSTEFDLTNIGNWLSSLIAEHTNSFIFSHIKGTYKFDDTFDPMFHYMSVMTKIKYEKYYPYMLKPEVLLSEAQLLCDIQASILFNPNFFIFDKESLTFKYESKFFDYGYRDIIMTYIIDSLHDKGINFMTEEDLNTYAKIIYMMIDEIRHKFKQFFVNVKEFGSYNFNLATADSATRYHVRCLILKYIYENPKAKNTQIAKIFAVNRKTVIEVRKVYDRQTKEHELAYTKNIKSKIIELLNLKFDLNIKKEEVKINIQKKLNRHSCINYEDLREKPRGPRPVIFTVVSESIWVQALNDIANKTPSDFGLGGSTWSGQMLVDYFKKVHNLDVAKKYVYYLLRKFEVTSKFARRLNPKRNLEEVIDFVQKRFKLICEEAKRNGERIAFIDETHCNQGYHQLGFAPIGMRANMSYTTSAAHTVYSLLVIASPDGLIEIFKIDGTFDAKKFKKCIQELHKRHPNDKFVLIADNSRVHHALLIKQWYNTLKKLKKHYFRLEFLPAYCPELNPVEFFNNDFKSYLRRRALRNADDVSKATDDYIYDYMHEYIDKQSIEERVKKFFQAPSCIYSWKIYNEIFHAELSRQVV